MTDVDIRNMHPDHGPKVFNRIETTYYGSTIAIKLLHADLSHVEAYRTHPNPEKCIPPVHWVVGWYEANPEQALSLLDALSQACGKALDSNHPLITAERLKNAREGRLFE